MKTGGGGGGGWREREKRERERERESFPFVGEIFAFVTVFNPTIEVVTFRLRGWCVLGVVLLPAFTRLGHERQDLLSPCDEMAHVCTD